MKILLRHKIVTTAIVTTAFDRCGEIHGEILVSLACQNAPPLQPEVDRLLTRRKTRPSAASMFQYK